MDRLKISTPEAAIEICSIPQALWVRYEISVSLHRAVPNLESFFGGVGGVCRKVS